MSDDNSKAWPFPEVTKVVKEANLHAQEKLYIPTSHVIGRDCCGPTPEKLARAADEQLAAWAKDLKPAPNPYNKAVHSPDHYTRGGIETIDFIEAKGLGFHLGNTVKYVSRAGFKQDAKVQDLEKAMWYLMREINRLDPEFIHTTSKVKK